MSSKSKIIKRILRNMNGEYSFVQRVWHKYLGLPTVVELGKSEHNALPSSFFDNKFPDDPSGVKYTWEDYYVEMKEKYPVKYFINRDIPDFFSNIKNKFRFVGDAWYWTKCHTLPSYRFHLVDIRQPKRSSHPYRYGYTDPVEKILLANFSILVEFVEKEEPYNLRSEYTDAEIDQQNLRHQQDVYDEFMALYNWWKTDRANELASIEARYEIVKDCKLRVQYDKVMKDWMGAREDFDKHEDEMLIRLMKVRRSLWT